MAALPAMAPTCLWSPETRSTPEATGAVAKQLFATPSQLALALGKDGKAYLLGRSNLGGITAPVASANVANSVRGQSAATYRTSQGTYFVFRNGSSSLSAYRITATNPPTIVRLGTSARPARARRGLQLLMGLAGGGPNELMANTRKWNTGIVARGRIYFAADNKVYAFAVPPGLPRQLQPQRPAQLLRRSQHQTRHRL